MNRLRERLRRLPIDLYLWSQRRRFPLPAAVRSIGNVLLARTIGRTIPDRTDEWPHPLNWGTRGDDSARLPTRDPACSLAAIEPTALARSACTPLWPEIRPRLRCIVVTGSLDLGGLEIVVALLGRRLPLHGLDTTVVHAPLIPGISERLANSLRLEGVPVVRLSQRDVRQWLETHRPDIISMHRAPDWLLTAAAEFRIPTIETLHDASTFFDRDTWQSEQLRSRQITGFVAVSELVRRQYLKANPEYPSDRIITILTGVDERHITRRDRTQARTWLKLRNEFLFLSLARYSVQKNTFGLVMAFSEVVRAHPEAHLLVAGAIWDLPYFEQVRRLREGLPCADHIHLCGPCPDVSAVLAAADAFVLDSFFEGGPLVSMEALVAGLPVVISDAGWAREQVGENGRRGFVVGNPLGDPEVVDWPSMGRARFRRQINRTALVDAMCAVVADRDRWQDAREQLRAESIGRFSIDLCVQRHAEVLTRAAASASYLSPVTDPT